MKKLVLVCLIEAAIAGYSAGAMADIQDDVITENKSGVIVRENQHLHLNRNVTGTDFIIENGGQLSLNATSILNGAVIKSGGEVSFSEDTRSTGTLVIEKSAEVFANNTNEQEIDVTTNNPAVPGNVTFETVDNAGLLEIGPAWTGGAEVEDFAPMPDKLGADLVTTINTLNMKGGMVALEAYSPAAQQNHLKIGTLTGQGDFYISTQMADGWGDHITVSNKATGNFGIEFADSGKEPKSATRHTVVSVNSGDAAFRLLNKDETAEIGAYQYSLKKTQSGESTEWYLQGKRKGDKDTDNGNNGGTKPVLSYSARGVMAMAAAPRQVLQAESVSLQQRLGNYYSNPQHGYGLWTRYLHDNTRLNDKNDTAFKNKLDGMQIGVDKPLRLNDATVLVGVFTGFSRSKVSTSDYGNGTVESWHGGLYATYLHDSGFYADTMLKGNRLDNSNNGRMKNGSAARGDYHQNAFTATIESGFNYEILPALTVQPYGRLQYARIGSADYELSNGMRADIHSADSFQGEAGTLVSTSFEVSSAVLKPYARLAVVHEFTKENDVTINRTNTFSNDFSGSTGKYGLGLDAQITPQAAFYTEINYLNGNKSETPLSADLGFRVRF
ncbi:autotransporter outer membrane beta-barrel domain-containing protein [Morganella morganii]|uniref:autotransporter outer membrane beta-barrel domain-containing protein n=1 Tax=Morganella morganii TaxID=582 RepID=UPI0024BB73AA|nr:autotransporter outer membrane beta-barrel domain-containing protein [Morganella morganii]EKK5378313.1 autotransporter outer membrane beta-barrel domain-containing protein [Morganella morganii]ELB1546416.1 autotransporter outer membrane beta-barrel domain-containing protein [Morganella morganii]BEP19327.1 autotransporter adhesin YapC [Morganella morganii subsp. sibonii]HDU8311768.1 autotransporter outer membrane beta-barrel domain-containing protein [Morganella morganii subsp. sibonii]